MAEKKLRLKNEIRQMIAMIKEITVERIDDAASLSHELGLDSLQILELLVCLEKKYGIKIHHEELKEFITVNRVAEVVSSFMEKGSAA